MNKNNRDPLLFRFLTEVGIIDQLATAKLESALPDGMKTSQFLVLNHLVRLGGEWSPARLATALQVTRGAMTNTLNRLESRRLIEVSPDPGDGRAKLVSLTAAGRDTRERCVQSVQPMLAAMESALGRRRFERALPLLEESRRYLDEHRD